MGSRPWRTRSRRSMRFGGTIMSIILTELSRVKAPRNSRKGCSQRPRAHSRSGPRNPVLSRRGHSPVTIGPKKPGRSDLALAEFRSAHDHPRAKSSLPSTVYPPGELTIRLALNRSTGVGVDSPASSAPRCRSLIFSTGALSNLWAV